MSEHSSDLSSEHSAAPQTIIAYRIDRNDRFVGISSNWQSFAIENGGTPKLVHILGQSLGDHICDKDTQDVYVMLLDAVRRAQSSVSFPYRCDSPYVKRSMRLTISAEPGDAVSFHSEILNVEPLAQEIHFGVTPSYKVKHVHVCSNCRKVKVADRWLEVTDAFESGELTANKNRFVAVYRVCGGCLTDPHERSSRMLAATDGRMNQLRDMMDRYHEAYTGGGALKRPVGQHPPAAILPASSTAGKRNPPE